jgi:hypothetical protein
MRSKRSIANATLQARKLVHEMLKQKAKIKPLTVSLRVFNGSFSYKTPKNIWFHQKNLH